MESACQRGNLHLLALCLFLVAYAADGEDYYATCTIKPLELPGMNISGTIMLYESGSTNLTTLVGHLYGFENITNTKRGFHVHEFGNLDNNCVAAGLHYNPFNQAHGAPNDNIRHVGDLGNIVVDSKLETLINITDRVISLHGNYSIANRSLVVHAGVDDLGMGNFSDSKTTGHSGMRIGCCIINLDQQTTPVVQQTTPVVQQTTPVVQQTTPVVQQTTPVVQQTTPVVQQTTSVTSPRTSLSSATWTTMSSSPPGTDVLSSITTPMQGSPNEAAAAVGSLPAILLICCVGLQYYW